MRPNTWITPIGNWGKGRSNWSRFPVQRKSTITSSPIGFPRICRRWVSSSKLHIAFIFRAKISWTPLRSCNRYAGRRRRADLCSEQEDFRLLHSRTAVLMPICNENVAFLPGSKPRRRLLQSFATLISMSSAIPEIRTDKSKRKSRGHKGGKQGR